MRRFIAYSLLAATMVAAVGVSASPVLSEMNAGREFNSGYEITFKVESLDADKDLNENASKIVADEMSVRLGKANFEDYSVKVEKGYDDVNNNTQSVTVSFSCDESMYNDVCKYLTFSGTKFAFSKSDEQEESVKEDVIDYENVKIQQFQDRIPIVVIPLTDSGKTDLENLLSTEEESGEETKLSKRVTQVYAHDDEGNPLPGEEDANSEPDIFLWGNYELGDNYSTAKENPYILNKIIAGFSSQNIWYTKEDGAPNDYVEHSAIKIICGSMNQEGSSYDFTKIADANVKATFYKNMLQASAYEYKITCPSANIVPGNAIDYLSNAVRIEPTNEYLIVKSRLALSSVLITSLIAIAVVSICLAVYYKLFSIGAIATTLSTLFLTILVTVKMGTLVNIPFLVALIGVILASLFGQIIYLAKVKEEVYKGRTLKKANQEASKKSNLLTLDASIVLAIAGLMIYLLGGVALKPMGGVLFFGSIIVLLMNLVVFKILMYLLTNSFELQTKYKLFGIKEEFIPNLMLEQKPNYVAPLEKTNFTKSSKVAGVVLAALTTVSLFGILFFGIKDGTPLNVAKATENTTVIYTTLRNAESTVSGIDTFKKYVLEDVEYNSIEMKNVSVQIDEEGNQIDDQENTFFIVKINKSCSVDEIENIKEKISSNITENVLLSDKDFDVEVNDVTNLVYTPNQGLVALATGISIVAVSVYFMFRFRPSRGLASFVSTVAATTIAYGIIAITRIGTTPVASVAMPIVAVSTLLMTLLYLGIEKNNFKENHEELTLDVRNEIMKKSVGKAALPIVILFIGAGFMAINYFGFGLQTTTFLFASMLIGVVIGFLSTLMLTGPMAEKFAKLFSKLSLPKHKSQKKNINTQNKQKSSEPEETTFIGIND